MSTRLTCPTCEYELDGLQPVDGGVRCPECGEVSSIGGVGEARQRRLFVQRLASVVAAPALVTLAVGASVMWGEGGWMLAAPCGAVAVSVFLGIGHLCEPRSGLSSRRRRRLLLAGLIAHAVMMGMALAGMLRAAEQIAAC